MRCYKFWARGESTDATHMPPRSVTSFGFSNESLEDALAKAEARANQIAQRLASGQPLDEYEYLNLPMREEIIEELDFDGKLAAVITRNGYGALILNSANVLFADVDLPAANPLGWFKSLFSKPKESPTDQLIQKIDQLCQLQSGLGIRLYRTKAGFRALVTSETLAPTSSEAESLLVALGSDPLYVKLCHAQESFRARLTAKPWRIDLARPPHRYPFANQEQTVAFKQWLANYERKSESVAACALVGQFGNDHMPYPVELVVKVHDSYALGHDESVALA